MSFVVVLLENDQAELTAFNSVLVKAQKSPRPKLSMASAADAPLSTCEPPVQSAHPKPVLVTGMQRYRVDAETKVPTPLAEVGQPAVTIPVVKYCDRVAICWRATMGRHVYRSYSMSLVFF